MRLRILSPVALTCVALTCAATALTPLAEARPGNGYSMGSRGGRTYSAPPSTATAPGYARPMDRSLAPSSAPMPSSRPYPYGAPSRPMMGGGYANRHPFMTGFFGGFLGAGLFGLLSGHGFFGGFGGGGSMIGFLFQVLVFGAIFVWILRRLGAARGAGVRNMGGAPSSPYGQAPVTVTPDDYRAFQRLLVDIQAAWSAQNLNALSSMTTPEMASYFNEQLSDYASRGARNVTSNVRFLQGDLSEAWREGNLTYATVAMRYSLIDVTTDMMGNVIDGSTTTPVNVTELWTFLRADGRGNWVLSAIQQTT